MSDFISANFYDVVFSCIFVIIVFIQAKTYQGRYLNFFELIAIYVFIFLGRLNPLTFLSNTLNIINLFILTCLVCLYLTRRIDQVLIYLAGIYLGLFSHELWYFYLMPHLSLDQPSWRLIIWLVGSLVISWCVAKIYYLVIGKLSMQSARIRRYFFCGLGLFLLTLLGPAIYQDTLILTQDQFSFIYLISLYLILLTIFVLAVAIYYLGQEQVRQVQEERSQLQMDQAYYQMIQQQYLELRRFKHDHDNLMYDLSGLLQAGDLQAAKYFLQEELPDQYHLEAKEDSLGSLSRLSLVGIRQLCYAKLSYARSLGIVTTLEITDDLADLQVSSASLTRMLGIIIDNAIEAGQGLSEAKLDLLIWGDNENATILVGNKAHLSITEFIQRDQLNYSSKGSDHQGLGLSNLNLLVERSHCLLYTGMREGMFYQELVINRKVEE
ncbi:GHKL domain-containing protein [Hutsoniella sourekii]